MKKKLKDYIEQLEKDVIFYRQLAVYCREDKKDREMEMHYYGKVFATEEIIKQLKGMI